MDYRPLSNSTNEIRILSITSAKDPQSPISCELQHVPLGVESNYVALSYTWGPQRKTTPVICHGRKVFITPSLDAGLRELRSRGHLRVWADALCINQEDLEERSLQVRRMAAIYRSAAIVIASLGGDDPKQCIQVKELLKATKYLMASAPERFDKRRFIVSNLYYHLNIGKLHWNSLYNLFTCEYWRRVWIVQELAMAINLEIIWGHQDLYLEDLKDALNICKFMENDTTATIPPLGDAKACSTAFNF